MRPVLFVIALAFAPGAALAQTTPDPTVSDDRFQIERSGDQFIRLDRKTGVVSTCTLQESALDCRMSADERAALQAEVDRLATEVEQLKAQMATAPDAGLSKDGKQLTLKLPTEADIKEAMSFLEDMFRRVVDAVRSLTNGSA